MSDKPTMNELIRAAARTSSADDDPTVRRLAENLTTPPAAPPPRVTGQALTAAIRRLASGAPSIEQAVRDHHETSTTIRPTARPIKSDSADRSTWIQENVRRDR